MLLRKTHSGLRKGDPFVNIAFKKFINVQHKYTTMYQGLLSSDVFDSTVSKQPTNPIQLRPYDT